MKASEVTPAMLAMMKPEDRAALGHANIDPSYNVKMPQDDGKQCESEKQLQRLCELELSRRKLWYLHLSPRAREKAGVPDLLFCVPAKLGSLCGHPVPWAVELKSETGRLSPEQRETHVLMNWNGWATAVIRSFEEFKRVVFGE